MSERRQVVKVRIGSEEYALRSDRPAEHTRAVAQHVDAALKEVQASGAVVETHKAAILAALAVADELFVARRQRDETTARLRQMAQELERLLPPARRPSRTSGTLFASPEGGT